MNRDKYYNPLVWFLIFIILFFTIGFLIFPPYDDSPVIRNYNEPHFSNNPCDLEIFSLNIISSNSNPQINKLASLLQYELPKACIGVDVHLSMEQSITSTRSTNYDVSAIPDKRVPLFRDGGYDMTLVEIFRSNTSEIFESFHSSRTVDKGSNWYNYQNATLDNLLESYVQDTNSITREEKARKIQQILHQDLPAQVIAVKSQEVANGTIITEYTWHELSLNMLHPVFGTGYQTPFGQEEPSRAYEAARYVRQAIAHAIPKILILSEIYEGKWSVGITHWMEGMDDFDETLVPYEYSIAQAKEKLWKAGFD